MSEESNGVARGGWCWGQRLSVAGAAFRGISVTHIAHSMWQWPWCSGALSSLVPNEQLSCKQRAESAVGHLLFFWAQIIDTQKVVGEFIVKLSADLWLEERERFAIVFHCTIHHREINQYSHEVVWKVLLCYSIFKSLVGEFLYPANVKYIMLFQFWKTVFPIFWALFNGLKMP